MTRVKTSAAAVRACCYDHVRKLRVVQHKRGETKSATVVGVRGSDGIPGSKSTSSSITSITSITSMYY